MTSYPMYNIPSVSSTLGTQAKPFFPTAARSLTTTATPMDRLQRLAMNGPTNKLQPVKVSGGSVGILRIDRVLLFNAAY